MAVLGSGNGNACSWTGCGRPMTAGQATVSFNRFSRALCPQHQRDHAEGVPEGLGLTEAADLFEGE
jgi:hypothetical protein